MNMTAFYNLSYGVYLCTSWDEGKPVGCVANSAMQITSAPATIAVSLNRVNHTHSCVEKTGYFSICVLGEKADPKLIGNFGFRTSKETDKFAATPHAVRGKLPIPDGCLCYFCCKVVSKMETATHTVFLGEVYEAEVLHGGAPMTYAYYHKVLKGKTSANAPTYVEEKKSAPSGVKYVCDICGYEYDGDIPFEDLPADWKCPLCSAGKESFTRVDTGEPPVPKKKYVCKVCGYEYDGDVPFEELPEDWVCPLCGMPKSEFEEVEA